MIKVSVIVPVYNVKDYIKECIDSLLRQTLKEIEIIVVNDGSTDTSLEVLGELATGNPDSNIIIITQENQGLSAARNTGAAKARGEYLVFIDGDDWIEPEMLQEMYEGVARSGAEVGICGYNKRYSDRQEIISGGRIPAEFVADSKEILRLFLVGKIVIVAWNKIFQRAFYQKYNFQFPIGYLYEDIPLILLISKANKIIKVDKPFYNYRQREGSIMKTLKRSMLGKYDLVEQVKQHLLSEGYFNNLMEEFQWFYGDLIILQLINGFIVNGEGNPALRDEMIKEILAKPDTQTYLKKVWKNQYFDLRSKVALSLLKMYPSLYKGLYQRLFVKK